MTHQFCSAPVLLDKAMDGVYLMVTNLRNGERMSYVRSMGLSAMVVTVVCAGGCAWALGSWWGVLLGVNVAAFLYYGFDKYRAAGKGWRVPEAVLLGFALACGAPGSFLGQRVFNHKTAKTSFKRAFWAITILQAAALTALIIYLRRN
jgi:uncharacterized membrane protein YsdA (DUF1294 family)